MQPDFPPSPLNWIDRLSPDLRGEVLAAHRPLGARASRDAFQPGDYAPGLFRVLEGRVDMYAVQADGGEVMFNCYFPGECFGELPVLDGGVHIATMVQTPGSRLSMMPADAVARLRAACPEFERALTLSVCQTLRLLFSYHFAKMTLSPEEHLTTRLMDYCARLRGEQGAEIRIPINQDAFAKQLGLSRRTVVDVLNRLEGRGQIRREYGAIVVCSSELDGP